MIAFAPDWLDLNSYSCRQLSVISLPHPCKKATVDGEGGGEMESATIGNGLVLYRLSSLNTKRL